MRSFMRTVSPSTSKTNVTGDSTSCDQLPELGDDRREAARPRAHVEQLDDERVARLGAAHRDRPRRAVHAREVDRRDEVFLRRDLTGEAVVRLERDDGARLDLEHGLEVRPEAPDHVVARDAVLGCDRHRRRDPTPRAAGYEPSARRSSSRRPRSRRDPRTDPSRARRDPRGSRGAACRDGAPRTSATRA